MSILNIILNEIEQNSREDKQPLTKIKLHPRDYSALKNSAHISLWHSINSIELFAGIQIIVDVDTPIRIEGLL